MGAAHGALVGKRFPEAVRLSQIGLANWSYLDGEHTSKGVNIAKLPLHKLLNVILVWALDRQPNDKRQEFVTKLNAPLVPEGETINPHRVADEDFDDSYDQIKQ